MKGNITSLHSLQQLKGIVLALLVLFCCFPAFSQNSGAAQDLGDLSEVKWKVAADVNTTLAVEQAKMTLALSSPTVADDEKALFKGYQRLLNYIQAEMLSGKPLDEAIMVAYDQVLAEAPKDTDLSLMPSGLLMTYVPGLVEALTFAPIPGN
jgi:hypothetical protein